MKTDIKNFYSQFISELRKLNIVNFIALIVAGIVNSIGITMFLQPVSIYDSGFSGTAMLIANVTPNWLTLPVMLVIINLPFFLFGLKKQGIVFTVYSVFAVAVYSISASVITDVIFDTPLSASPIVGDDLLLCAIFGGILSGFGSGITIRFGGAIDGVDVMAVIFAENLGITVGSFVMVYNVILYVIAGAISHSWVLPLYSIITYMAALKTVDFIVEGLSRGKAAMIITSDAENVSAALSQAFGISPTIIQGRGYYYSANKEIVYFVVNRFQIGKMKAIIKEYDPSAFVAITEAAEMFGVNVKK